MDRLRTWKVWLKLVVTFLVGVACVSPSLGDSLDDLYKRRSRKALSVFTVLLLKLTPKKSFRCSNLEQLKDIGELAELLTPTS
jgi:hypothetical protein